MQREATEPNYPKQQILSYILWLPFFAEYKCRICLIEYRSAEELKEHGWEKHAKTTCTDCGTIFVKGVYMRSHISAKVCQKKDADAVDE